MIERLNTALEGRYHIDRELGAGGMATVYLADDLKHDRKVALKVLKPELAAVVGAERFLAEIKTTANLQHPHILPLFDSGEADGFLFYVMPYVEGESLRDLLDREKQLPVDQAVDLARKVAAALQHAHDRGVVHRDIKPANILLSEGEPLVADFGIALAVNTAGGGRITETGLSLGTPHYMSPEQASGDRSLDPRSDVYALGCVLYEALAGEPPFPGPTPQAVLARILTTSAQPVTATRPTVPPHVSDAVARALAKLPADRFPSVDDFRKALDDPSFRYAGGSTGPVAELPGRSAGGPGRQRWLAVAVAALLVAAAAWGWLRPGPEEPFRMFAVTLTDAGSEFGPLMAVSPDGRMVAYVTTGSGLAVQPLSSTDHRVLPIDLSARAPFFSPDGTAVGYHAGAANEGPSIRWIRLEGGGSIKAAEGAFPSGDWESDGYIYYEGFGAEASLWRVRAQGGEPEMVSDSGYRLAWPQAIGGGDWVIASYWPEEESTPRPAIVDTETGEVREIVGAGLEGSAYVRFANGYLFWVDGDYNLLAARMDPGSARVTSPAVNLATQILSGGANAGASVSVSDEGTLVYARGLAANTGLAENLAWVEHDGSVEILEERLAQQLSDFDGLAIGPNERYVAVQVDPPGETGGGNQEIWIFDTRQSTVYPLTFDDASYDPEWLDERMVAYARDVSDSAGAIYAQPFDRSEPETLLLELDREVWQFEPTPDGRRLLLTLPSDREEDASLFVVELDDPTSLRPFLDTPFEEFDADISPDGRWVAYVSDESGRDEVYVRSFPDGGRPWPISTEGGSVPRWSPGSDALYYESGRELYLATIDFTEGVDVSQVTRLFDMLPDFEPSGYEPSADGQRLLMIKEGGGNAATASVIMLNVFDEIERRLRQ